MGIYQVFINTIRQVLDALFNLSIYNGVDMLTMYVIVGIIVILLWFFRKAVRE